MNDTAIGPHIWLLYLTIWSKGSMSCLLIRCVHYSLTSLFRFQGTRGTIIHHS